MKLIFTSPDSAEVGLLKNLLEQAGIRCVERNEQMAQTLPVAPFQAELWVENEADYPEARALLAAWAAPATSARVDWVCGRCGELLGGQFTHCWKCDTPRPPPA